MSMMSGQKKAIVLSSALLMAVSGICTQVSAAPFATAGSSQLAAESMIEQVQVRPAGKRRPVPVARARKRNNNAAAAAIVGIGILGIAAAAAASQGRPRAGQYYTDQWGNPVDAYGRPIYVERPVQYYQQPGYYQQQPGYYYEQPGYDRRPQVSEWERQEIRARERAQREAAQQQWRQQQQIYQPQPQYRQAPVYRQDPSIYGRGYAQPGSSDFRERQRQRGIGDPTQDKGQ
ncbi:MAG: hypothetical protein NTZ14_15360 [Hyphomicrobiales bacterium]|nr:hypothetical protein [Hyphomicrobiales bacterium]